MRALLARSMLATLMSASGLGAFGYACVFSNTTSNKDTGSSVGSAAEHQLQQAVGCE